MNLQRTLAIAAGILGALGVAAGAFGAHGLRARVAPELLAVWETAARYHLLHAVVLLVLVAAARPAATPIVPFALLAGGIAVFSGSLYALVLTGVRGLGAVTPLGGLLLIAGWIAAGLWLARPLARPALTTPALTTPALGNGTPPGNSRCRSCRHPV